MLHNSLAVLDRRVSVSVTTERLSLSELAERFSPRIGSVVLSSMSVLVPFSKCIENFRNCFSLWMAGL